MNPGFVKNGFEIPNHKPQIPNKFKAPISNHPNNSYWEFGPLEFICYLVLACLPVGREFGAFLFTIP
jgi:hypothetical protein